MQLPFWTFFLLFLQAYRPTQEHQLEVRKATGRTDVDSPVALN